MHRANPVSVCSPYLEADPEKLQWTGEVERERGGRGKERMDLVG